MEPTGGGTQMLVHKQLSVPQPAIQGQNPAASTFPKPTNRSRGVCKIPAATPLGFPGLVCWASASPWAGLLCCCSSMPGVSGTCVGVCGARRAPPSLTLLLLREDEALEELLGQLVTRVGDVHGYRPQTSPFPEKGAVKVYCPPNSHGVQGGWLQLCHAALVPLEWDSGRMAAGWPSLAHEHPPRSRALLETEGHCDLSVTAEALAYSEEQLWALGPDQLPPGTGSALQCF